MSNEKPKQDTIWGEFELAHIEFHGTVTIASDGIEQWLASDAKKPRGAITASVRGQSVVLRHETPDRVEEVEVPIAGNVKNIGRVAKRIEAKKS